MNPFHLLPTYPSLPSRFNNPFDYRPSEVVRLAEREVVRYITSREEWSEELSHGKMFGVLVVRNRLGDVGYLAAFSGNLAGVTRHSYFVPPIFDLHAIDSFFLQEQQRITDININIEHLLREPKYLSLKVELEKFCTMAKEQEQSYKAYIKEQKQLRDTLRKEGVEQTQLIKQSQYQKAELKRIERRNGEFIAELKSQLEQYELQVSNLKQQRQHLSQELQRRLFESYIVRNAHLSESSLLDIFRQYNNTLPPAGAGECAAPKMLNYAYENSLTPIAMGEFWWGDSPRGEVRHHGEYYTSCKAKCEPILGYMLQGLDIESSSPNYSIERDLRVLYQDEWIVVVDKPAGMLSVKGRVETPSVEAIISTQYADAKLVHRLDMDTSGVLVVALDSSTHSDLQRQFSCREVKKEYVAMLDGHLESPKGEVNLPLSADYEQRPRQRVDYIAGKESLTSYKVISHEDGMTRVLLSPHTGRTHQLRLHCAHRDGLGTPIVGDRLYGHPSRRLMLHAREIILTHPATGEQMIFTSEAEF